MTDLIDLLRSLSKTPKAPGSVTLQTVNSQCHEDMVIIIANLQALFEREFNNEAAVKDMDSRILMAGFLAGRMSANMRVMDDIDDDLRNASGLFWEMACPEGYQLAAAIENTVAPLLKSYGKDYLIRAQKQCKARRRNYLPSVEATNETKDESESNVIN